VAWCTTATGLVPTRKRSDCENCRVTELSLQWSVFLQNPSLSKGINLHTAHERPLVRHITGGNAVTRALSNMLTDLVLMRYSCWLCPLLLFRLVSQNVWGACNRLGDTIPAQRKWIRNVCSGWRRSMAYLSSDLLLECGIGSH
jgi:hypothetical protein